MLKNQKGITLVALVITIIVLLILAGVSIAMLTGDNGVLTKASDSDRETARAGAVERINMALQAEYANILSAATPTMPAADALKTANGLGSEYKETHAATITTEGNVITLTWSNSKYGADISGHISYTANPTDGSTQKYKLVPATK